MTSDNQAIADFTLERQRLGELSAADASEIERRAAVDPDVRARLEALAASDAEIRAQYGDDWLAQAVTRRLRDDRRSPLVHAGRMWIALAGTAAVVVLSAALLPGLLGWMRPAPSSGPEAGTDGNRVKGEIATLVVYRNAAAGSQRLNDGEGARAGDLVRVAYRASTPRFGVIVSIDGRGAVTRHLPVAGDAAIALQPGEETPLAAAYELDDAPRWERFFLITSANEFAVGPVVEAARSAAAKAGVDPPATLALPAGFEQTSFLLRKVS